MRLYTWESAVDYLCLRYTVCLLNTFGVVGGFCIECTIAYWCHVVKRCGYILDHWLPLLWRGHTKRRQGSFRRPSCSSHVSCRHVVWKGSQRKCPIVERSRRILHQHKSCPERRFFRWIQKQCCSVSVFYTYCSLLHSGWSCTVPSLRPVVQADMPRRLIVSPSWSNSCTTGQFH